LLTVNIVLIFDWKSKSHSPIARVSHALIKMLNFIFRKWWSWRWHLHTTREPKNGDGYVTTVGWGFEVDHNSMFDCRLESQLKLDG